MGIPAARTFSSQEFRHNRFPLGSHAGGPRPLSCSGVVALSPEDPAPLPYLSSAEDRQNGGVDLNLEVLLSSLQMWSLGIEPALLSRSNFRDLYWALGQLITHHASNGCNLCPGVGQAAFSVMNPLTLMPHGLPITGNYVN